MDFSRKGEKMGKEKQKALNKLLFVATEAKIAKVVKIALEEGADINAVDRYNATALHEAAANGDFTIAVILIEAGIDREIRTLRGNKAADLARKNGFIALASLLESPH